MKRKVYYLNWDREEDIDSNVLRRMAFGFDKGETVNLEWYRVHEYNLEANTLEGIYTELNDENRFNGREERSLSIGDIVEFEGGLYGVDGMGFFNLWGE